MMNQQDPIRLLYMEDDPGLARLLQKALERVGHEVDLAGNGEEGLSKLADGKYDLLLIDYHMPGLCGLDVLRSLDRMVDPPPAIMVTGSGNERTAVEALRLGAADYIVKDAAMGYLELLPVVIDKVLAKQRLQSEKDALFADIQASEERFRNLVELSPDGIVLLREGRIGFVNSAGLTLLGVDREEDLIGRRLTEYLDAESLSLFEGQIRCVEETGQAAPWIEQRLLRGDGFGGDVEIGAGLCCYSNPQAFQIILRDISERVQARKVLEQMAHYDALTGLPNRTLFYDRLAHGLSGAKRYGNRLALLFLDLDGFKAINDTLGHAAGDVVLCEVGRRLQHCLRDCDTLARIGGDEFTVILGNCDSLAEAATVAGRLVAALEEPFAVAGGSCSAGVSIGISVFPEDGEEIDVLVRKADQAMYRVKEEGKNAFRFHSDHNQLSA